MALPSRLLRSERNKCPVFRVSAGRQVETTRNTSPLLHHLDVCHTFAPFKMRFNSKVYYFFVNKLYFPKKPDGLSYVIVRRVPFLSCSTYFRLLDSPIINTAIEMP